MIVGRRIVRLLTIGVALPLLAACATTAPIDLNEAALAQALAQRPVVLLGEVHDNAAQHAARAAALRRLLAAGARPALAFEQFDRERQPDIDRARRETPPPGRTPTEHVIAQSSPAHSSWDWALYRPYVALALEYDLPIVAANLSRADAMKVAREGFGAVFDAATINRYSLDKLPPALLAAHERAVDDGHCNRMPAASLPALARAQVARDVALLQAIRPYFGRGVVLLTGNGHVRNDIGVPALLSEAERSAVISIGLLERDQSHGHWPARFDVAFSTPAQPRGDPCASLPIRR